MLTIYDVPAGPTGNLQRGLHETSKQYNPSKVNCVLAASMSAVLCLQAILAFYSHPTCPARDAHCYEGFRNCYEYGHAK